MIDSMGSGDQMTLVLMRFSDILLASNSTDKKTALKAALTH